MGAPKSVQVRHVFHYDPELNLMELVHGVHKVRIFK